ncbi:unnamed protein product [Gemmata massiliana]|uniref:Uncharacterized protein n=1 Tax=Gemmata massiliana TaxID=1210884 RepID=A0A6P2D1Q3_9BACT|nr:hypothetical protein [Gemmata massiliana]VTR95211.1 unnamed protein product [Gemmata massiliana]
MDRGFDKLTGVITKAGTVTADFATKPLQLFTKGLDTLTASALKVIGMLGEFRDSVTAVGNALGQFVQLASPAIVQRFKFASDDLTASSGRRSFPRWNSRPR